MVRTLKICVSAAALCFILLPGGVAAQEAEASAAEPEPYTVTPGPAAVEAAVDAAAAASDAEGSAAEAKIETEAETDAAKAAAAEAAIADAAVAGAAAAEGPQVVEAEPVKPKKEKKAKPPKEPKPPREPRDSDSEGAFHVGVRGAFGASSFAGHKAFRVPAGGNLAIELGTGLSGSAGISVAGDFADLITVSIDVLYSIYTARGGYYLKEEGKDIGVMNEAGVELHSVEAPVLARFNFNNIFGPFYAEVGPQFGANIYGKIYKNAEWSKPYVNGFAVGVAAGLGLGIPGKAAIGVRGCFNFLDYAENVGGKPWAVQVGVTKYYVSF
jgi:hypothetical protein